MKSQIGFTKDKLVYCEVWPEPRYLEDGFRLDKEPTYLQAIASALEKGIPFETGGSYDKIASIIIKKSVLFLRLENMAHSGQPDKWFMYFEMPNNKVDHIHLKEGNHWDCPEGVKIEDQVLLYDKDADREWKKVKPINKYSKDAITRKVAILPTSIYGLKSPRTNVLSFTKNTSMIKCGDILYNKLGNPLHLIAYSDQFDNGKITVLPMFDEKAVPIDMDINNLEVVETFEFLTWPNNEVKEVMRQKQNLILFLDNLRKY